MSKLFESPILCAGGHTFDLLFRLFPRMNHLAHCFLSFGDEDLLLGNFIGDYVKGRQWQAYPPAVQRGILLHRQIDSFTDQHPLTNRSVERIRPFAGRYAPAYVDILYDHLLALHWENYGDLGFEDFTQKTYVQLQNRVLEMPEPLQSRLPRMLEGRFLHGYALREGLEWVLQRFSERLSGLLDANALADAFFEKIDLFSEDFKGFFPSLMLHARNFIAENPVALPGADET